MEHAPRGWFGSYQTRPLFDDKSKLASLFGIHLVRGPVQWAASGGAWKPAPTPLNVGVMENLEVRVPISPELVIVMDVA